VPVTLPAHAAAILPLQHVLRRLLPGTALLAGCMSPDLAYVVGPLQWGRFSHDGPTFAFFCLPAGLLLYAWLELLLLPALRRRLPEMGGVQWGRFARSPGLPRHATGWALAAVAVLLGAVTHVLWDGFTHGWMWPARVLYPGVQLSLGGHAVRVTKLLQHGSSLLGSVLVLAVLARRYPRLERCPGPPARAFAPLVLWTLIFGLAGLLVSYWRRPLRLAGLQGLEVELWWSFWPSVAGALIGLSIACAVAVRNAHTMATAGGGDPG
jgi:hypothetical protein